MPRRSVRLRHFDYRTPGAYFITICTRDALPLLGEIVEGVMHLSEIGRIKEAEWHRTAVMRPSVRLDAFVIMPDHLHGIVWITGADTFGGGRGAARCAPTKAQPELQAGSLSAIVRGFKSASTRSINLHRGIPGAPVWQRGFYEHVIRHDRALHAIRRYIAENPARWALKHGSPHPFTLPSMMPSM